MNRSFLFFALLVAVIACLTAGCGNFVAHRMVQAPNRYPQWLAPEAPVELVFPKGFLGGNYPPEFVKVGPPEISMCYQVIEPQDFELKCSVTNWTRRGKEKTRFVFEATVPGATNQWTANSRGTVILLHGYGVAQFAMAPWALQLAQDGWRCVLVDLRGHGLSTGRQVYYGVKETRDLTQLLDHLDSAGRLRGPVAVMGESYGAALALRWSRDDRRVQRVVAIAPYATLSNAVVNLCGEYAGWAPDWFLKSGLKRLPAVLGVDQEQLDTVTLLARDPATALFVAGARDEVIPPAEVRLLFDQSPASSRWLEVTGATHEAVPYYFDQLAQPVRDWMNH